MNYRTRVINSIATLVLATSFSAEPAPNDRANEIYNTSTSLTEKCLRDPEACRDFLYRNDLLPKECPPSHPYRDMVLTGIAGLIVGYGAGRLMKRISEPSSETHKE
jgi:hypothetical protein